jgi:polyisoprenoid-binding protein YceI
LGYNTFPRLLLGILLLLGCGVAAARSPCAAFEGTVNPRLIDVMRSAALQGRLFQVVPGASSVGFCVKRLFGPEFRAEATNIVGGLALPPAPHMFGQALLMIRTNSLMADEPSTLSMAKGPDFMDTQRYPDILFIGRAFQWLSPLQGYIYGDLTLHGYTRPVVFNVKIEILESGLGDLPTRILLTGTSHVSRREFGMYNHPILVSDEVNLCLSAELMAWDH